MGRWNWKLKFRWDAELSNEEALDLIRYILEYGRTIYSEHAMERMAERGFTPQDIEAIIETGKVIEQEFDSQRKNWKYKVCGTTIEHEYGVVITAVTNHAEQIFITVC